MHNYFVPTFKSLRVAGEPLFSNLVLSFSSTVTDSLAFFISSSSSGVHTSQTNAVVDGVVDLTIG
jgi:hypothetical protein